jgi:hypothetical protein
MANGKIQLVFHFPFAICTLNCFSAKPQQATSVPTVAGEVAQALLSVSNQKMETAPASSFYFPVSIFPDA